MVRAIAFDAYGTLLELPRPASPYTRFFTALGRPVEKSLIMGRDYESCAAFANAFGCFDAETIRELERNVRADVDSATPFAETAAVLDACHEAGLKLALISNLAAPYREPLRRSGLESRFDAVSYSFQVGRMKPDPEIFGHTARSLNIPPSEILMVGDSLTSDFQGALAAGMRAVFLDRQGRRPDIYPRLTDLTGLMTFLGR